MPGMNPAAKPLPFTPSSGVGWGKLLAASDVAVGLSAAAAADDEEEELVVVVVALVEKVVCVDEAAAAELVVLVGDAELELELELGAALVESMILHVVPPSQENPSGQQLLPHV